MTKPATRSFDRWSILLLVGLSTFVLCFFRAVTLYPGGTFFHRDTIGHSFWHNFLCDLTRPVALNGRENPGVSWAVAALCTLGLTTIPFWWRSAYAHREHKARTIRWAGMLSGAGVCAVALTPSSAHPQLHAVLIAVGGVPGLLAATLVALEDLRRKESSLVERAAPVLVLVPSVLLGVLYYSAQLRGVEVGTEAPILQRSALVASLLWMALKLR